MDQDNTDRLKPLKRSNVVNIIGGNREKPENRQPAILEWTSDNRIRLYTPDFVLFDCMPTDVKQFSVDIGEGNLELTDGQYFILNFSDPADGKLPKESFMKRIYDSFYTYNIDKRALRLTPTPELDWWAKNLTQQ